MKKVVVLLAMAILVMSFVALANAEWEEWIPTEGDKEFAATMDACQDDVLRLDLDTFSAANSFGNSYSCFRHLHCGDPKNAIIDGAKLAVMCEKLIEQVKSFNLSAEFQDAQESFIKALEEHVAAGYGAAELESGYPREKVNKKAFRKIDGHLEKAIQYQTEGWVAYYTAKEHMSKTKVRDNEEEQPTVGEKEIEQIVEDYMQPNDEGYNLFSVVDGEENLFHVVLYWKVNRQAFQYELTGTLVIDSNKEVVDPNATSEKLFYIPILYCTLIDSMWNPKADPNTPAQMRDTFAELEESLHGASIEWDRISKGTESDMELQFAALTIVSDVATLIGLTLNPPLTLLLEIKELGTYVAGAIAQESLEEFYHRMVIEEAEAIRDTLGEMATNSGEYSRVWQTLIDEDIYVGSGVTETAERAFPINDSLFDRIVEGQIVVLQKIKGLGNIIAPESDLQVIDDGITEYQRLENNIESELTPAFEAALNLFVTKQRPIPATTPKTEEGEWQLLLTDPDEPEALMDIKEIYAKVWEENIYFKVILHDSWPSDPYEYVEASIFLDTDQNQDTGVDSGSLWYGVNDIGANYRVDIYKDCNEVVKLDKSVENHSLWQTNLTYLSLPLNSNTFEVGVKLSDIGNPNAIDIIAILIDTEDGNMYWDYAPDEGKGHATYTIGSIIHSKFVDFDDDNLDTTISFYQRGHNIRVQVDGLDPGNYQINSGSVSISVDEDVDVHYNTGSVFGLLYQENDSKEIKPKMTRDEKTLLFSAGFIPGIGPGFGIVQYAIETTDHYEYDWYEEEDLTDSNLVPSIFFDSNDMLNSQDTIVIPWYLGTGYLPANSIQVNCPEMIFSEAGTYNIVFRVEYSIGLRISMLGKKVGYDVAIPITVV